MGENWRRSCWAKRLHMNYDRRELGYQYLLSFFFFEGASSVKSYFIFAQNWGKTRANTLILKGRGGISELVAIERKYSPLPVEGRGNKERRNTENIEGSNILEVFMAKRQGYRSSYNIKGTGLLSALSITRLFNFRHTP